MVSFMLLQWQKDAISALANLNFAIINTTMRDFKLSESVRVAIIATIVIHRESSERFGDSGRFGEIRGNPGGFGEIRGCTRARLDSLE